MRKPHLEQVANYIKLLEKLLEAIDIELASGDIEKTSKHLELSQQKAIELGSFIERLEGEGFVTVSYLEEYCEILYELNETLIGNSEDSPKDIETKLVEKLNTITESVKQDIPIKKEAVFLPYKASMWDSLESVWKKYAADEEYETYVIPIPYYDKDAKGDFIKEHYEIDQYPEEVPVVRYDDYDFGAHHPDKIFIHNPYDDSNLVTSVHPFFFSENLAKICEELIYIPYYVLEDPKEVTEKYVEGVEQYFVTPCMLHVSKAIVQSENMRQAYIMALNKYMPVRNWEEVIEGSGSPKFDRLLSIQKEDLDIPEDWLKVIRKPDGSWKKIIFFNTTVTAIINNEETYLPKLRNSLKIFKANEENVALLWRPHPLMEATLSSMEPQLYDEYMEIVNDYRAAGWGIFDDSPDMDRAIIISDGYYGDGSSAVQLYEKTGKPIMIENVEVLGEVD